MSTLQGEVCALKQHAPGKGENDPLKIDDIILGAIVEKRRLVEVLVRQHRRVCSFLDGFEIITERTLENRRELALDVVGQNRRRNAHRSGFHHPTTESGGVGLRFAIDGNPCSLNSLINHLRRALTLFGVGVDALHQTFLGARRGFAQIRVRVLLCLFQFWQQRRNEWHQISRVVNQCTDIPARHRSLLLEFLRAFAQTAENDW
mmetsp:Transcript_5305/g.19329  ORF Transcript_5305/g.19329 Transcript_5305/m.19329 type:complete len:204 (-) Transcript_5305:1479-2090(-)